MQKLRQTDGAMWSLSELTQAVIIVAHVHALSIFLAGCKLSSVDAILALFQTTTCSGLATNEQPVPGCPSSQFLNTLVSVYVSWYVANFINYKLLFSVLLLLLLSLLLLCTCSTVELKKLWEHLTLKRNIWHCRAKNSHLSQSSECFNSNIFSRHAKVGFSLGLYRIFDLNSNRTE